MKVQRVATWSVVAFGLMFFAPGTVLAHCDTLDGPVVTAARKALDARDPSQVLVWVRADDEPEIRTLFEQTLIVRAMGPQAKALADRFFFETLVRVHRAGEGAPYTGLKAAGLDLGPAIPAADKALHDRSSAGLTTLLAGAMEDGVRRHFDRAAAASRFEPGDVSAGREYVRAYVEFVHYVERLHQAITATAQGHFNESETTDTHRHQ